jgi:hypothetical protein
MSFDVRQDSVSEIEVDTCLFVIWYCRGDKMTSVVIPLAMATTVGLMWARGMWNLYTGQGKLE